MLKPLLALPLLCAGAIAQCTLTAPGTPLVAPPFDDWSSIQPIGFSFPFSGTTYTDFFVSDHSLVALSNAGTPPAPPAQAFLYNPTTANLVVGGPMLAPYWSDHTPGVGGSIHIDNTSGTHCTITWLDHQTFNQQTPPFTVQMTLYPSGNIAICLDDRVDNRGSTFVAGALNAIFGMSPGNTTLPTPSDISANPVTTNNTFFEEWVTTAPATPNPLFDIANRTITLIPTNPGWVVITDALACAANAQYGSGCNGLSLDSNAPIVGTTWMLTTTGIAPVSPISITFFGAGDIPAGLPLGSIGLPAPGCSAYVANIVSSAAAANAGGTTTLIVPLPLSATLKGATIFAQSLGLTLANPANLATSNGLSAELGF